MSNRSGRLWFVVTLAAQFLAPAAAAAQSVPDAGGAEWRPAMHAVGTMVDSFVAPQVTISPKPPAISDLGSSSMLADTNRPVWLLPAIGAVVVAGAFVITLANECADDDCLINPVPFAVGAALVGAAAGAVVELVLRLVED